MDETIRATVIKPNQAIKLRARKETLVRGITILIVYLLSANHHVPSPRVFGLTLWYYSFMFLPFVGRIVITTHVLLVKNGW